MTQIKEEKPGMKIQEIGAKESQLLSADGLTSVSGIFGGNSDQPDWALSNGLGIRSKSFPVKFNKPFKTKPELVIGGNVLLDIGNKTNARLRCDIIEVATDGFTANITTWGDTVIWAASYSWIAIGNV